MPYSPHNTPKSGIFPHIAIQPPEINCEFGEIHSKLGQFSKFQLHHHIPRKKLCSKHMYQNEHICTTEEVTPLNMQFWALGPR